MTGYLNSAVKSECFGCEACAQICGRNAISIQEDPEGFRYPVTDNNLCVSCGACNAVCPAENMPVCFDNDKLAFGGYHKNWDVRNGSTSGGAFSAIVDAWCDENYVIFGAAADGLRVYHSFITNKDELELFRKSKYSQSEIGISYKLVKQFLKDGKKVLFSGTPCQIAGLRAYLGKADTDRLLTIEVICEGVPSPLFVRCNEKMLKEKYGAEIAVQDNRYTDGAASKPHSGKWDFEVMYTSLRNGRKMKKDRWFNPFWSIWLNHLMSRPSCYKCPFTTTARCADITLGDLWGVHLYCPELYGNNGGASLVVCNTDKGKQALSMAMPLMHGHELDFETALKYQGPMRKSIDENADRDKFISDLQRMDYKAICRKWAKKPSVKLLWQKYVWGNRQKVFVWNLKKRLFK